MTQLDLPQISLQRYVELLKRRRWQVIPVSLLGLLVGGIVAFFIPRYFVATAVLTYQAPPGETQPGNEDPFGPIVESAQLTIPRSIESTIKALGWPEALATDAYELRENIAAIEDRLKVTPENAGKNKTFARIHVTYLDRDGIRAARFTNVLVETWVNQRIEEVTNQAREQLNQANAQLREYQTVWDKAVIERQNLERTYGIDPSLEPAVQKANWTARNEQRENRRDQLTAKRREVDGLEAKLAQLQERLKETLPRVAPDLTVLEAQAGSSPQGQQLVLDLLMATETLKRFNPPTSQHKRALRVLAQIKEEIAALPGGVAVGEDGLVPNPAHEKLVKEIAETQLLLDPARAEIATMQEIVAEDIRRIASLSDGYGEYEKVVQRIAGAQKRLDEVDLDWVAANDMLGKLGNKPPVKVDVPAQTPPQPTEPNIVLVALLGCLVGLLVATLLVLLLDILQGSFKTVDDVERGLPVPVLGGMSHLETEEERQGLQKGRRRMTLVAGLLVVLTSGVVLVFYYDPTRLPPFVRDLLALVLGA